MNLAEARRPALFTVKGVTLAFLGYDAISDDYLAGEERAGSVPADPALIAEDIAAARGQADVVIVYFHWGWEYTHDPSPWQQTLARQAVEAGADLVIGSHPHWVQGLERYRGVPILYSLGNFVADQMWSLETRQGLIAHLIFRGKHLVGLRLHAVQIEDYHQPRPLPAAEAEAVYQAIREASISWPGNEAWPIGGPRPMEKRRSP
jgi:poly-gamma-glutamate synthesis protein (capsule biosynthesis protein)